MELVLNCWTHMHHPHRDAASRALYGWFLNLRENAKRVQFATRAVRILGVKTLVERFHRWLRVSVCIALWDLLFLTLYTTKSFF